MGSSEEFRKSLSLLDWEHEMLSLQTTDLEAPSVSIFFALEFFLFIFGTNISAFLSSRMFLFLFPKLFFPPFLFLLCVEPTSKWTTRVVHAGWAGKKGREQIFAVRRGPRTSTCCVSRRSGTGVEAKTLAFGTVGCRRVPDGCHDASCNIF